MENIDLLEAAGVVSMLGGFGGGSDPILSAPIDDILDPSGYYKSHGLDPYGRPLSGASVAPSGPKPTSAVGKGTAAVKNVGAKLNALRQGYEAGVQPLVDAQTKALTNLIPQGPLPAKGGHLMKLGRMAGAALKNPLLQTGLKYAPVVGSTLAVGDVILGDESLANKGMDAAMMTAGGFLGSVVPVVGTGLGIAAGKMTSDGLQWLFGDKKSPEQRKMEEALAQLRGGVV